MALDPQQTACLIDSHGHYLGDVVIERIEGNRVFGRFSCAVGFDSLEDLFREFENAVNDQIFSVVDELASKIEALDLRLASSDGNEQLGLFDVQIMNTHDFCCRIPNLGLIQTSEAVGQVG